jgi:hypothetical protein
MRNLLIILGFLILGTMQVMARTDCKAIDAAISAKEDFVEMALTKNAADASAASLAALEDYKSLVAQHESVLPTTLPVAMLDYAGFKLRALVAADNLDWQAIAAARNQTKRDWAKVGLKNKAISDLTSSNLVSLDLAILQNNPKWVDSAAQILLDSVDLIEQQVKNPAQGACH